MDLAATYYGRSLKINPDLISAKESYETIINTLVERWHFRMLNDKKRNEAFENAITLVVQENKINWAMDIGSGTGILRYHMVSFYNLYIAYCLSCDCVHIIECLVKIR